MKKSFSQPILGYTSLSNNNHHNSVVNPNSDHTSIISMRRIIKGHSISNSNSISISISSKCNSSSTNYVLFVLFILALFSIFLSRTALLNSPPPPPPHIHIHIDIDNNNNNNIPLPPTPTHLTPTNDNKSKPKAAAVNLHQTITIRHVSSISTPLLNSNPSTDSVSILLPAWEVLVVVNPDSTKSYSEHGNYTCLYPNRDTSFARFAGVLPSSNQTIFKCNLPSHLRRQQPFPSPILTNSPMETPPSVQEVFRCQHPDLTDVIDVGPIKVSLEITQENRVVPSVAYYNPMDQRRIATDPRQQKSLVCACTMVYNVGKFIREWVLYHSKIGVEKFILYDNDSEDDLASEVHALIQDGYDIEIVRWIWPKTQEAGFSHSAVYAKASCTWMMYLDVDEFLFSPSWLNSSEPSVDMIESMLPSKSEPNVGQISIMCNDFGPSDQSSHPVEGVTQGYDCRRRIEQRHKSIVLLEAIVDSLQNVVHHFVMNQSLYEWTYMNADVAVVNHYKYQAWSEFKTKFRRRVSAYVADWESKVNLNSQDRTPGLGFQPIEPKGWAQMFCEVRDDRLKLLTQKWFGLKTPTGGYLMAWQRAMTMTIR
ncbi:hypothetical protein ACFE04_025834 [Oxalis oulophora]